MELAVLLFQMIFSSLGYCGKAHATGIVRLASCAGLGRIHVCGPRCEGDCRREHAEGVTLRHGSWQMTADGRAAVKRGRNSRGDSSDKDDEPMGPVSPAERRNARRMRT